MNWFRSLRGSSQPAAQPTTNATPTPANQPAMPLQQLARSGQSPARAGLRPRTAAVPQLPSLPAAVAQAMTLAGAAHAEVPLHVDAQGLASSAWTARQQSTHDITGRRTKADAEAATTLTARQQAVTAAQQQVQDTGAALTQRRTERDGHQTLLYQAGHATGTLQAALTAARDDPALAAARNDLRDTTAAVNQAPAAQRPPLQAAVDQARARVDGLERVIAQAQAAVDHNADDITQHRADLANAAAALGHAQSTHDQANAALTTAQASHTALTVARQRLADAVTLHTPALQAHAAAAQTAVTHADAATQAHRALAGLAVTAADASHALHAARAGADAQREIVRQAVDVHTREADLLGPTAALTRRLADCEAAMAAATTAVVVPGGPSVAEMRYRATIALGSVERDVAAQRQVVQTAHQGMTAAQATLAPLVLREAAATAAAAGADLAHATQGPLTIQADAGAATAAALRDGLKANADAAHQALDQAIAALCDELRPVPATAAALERTGKVRAMDALRRPLHSLERRSGPAKFDLMAGPLSLSTSGSAPTTFHHGQPPLKTPTAATSERQLRAVDKKVHVAAGKAGNLLSGGSSKTQGPAASPAAFGNAVAFTSEVGRLFAAAPTGELAATPAATHFAQSLLRHPNPDPAGRPDGHPLRHEQALLIASALRSVTADPAQAAQVYNQLWNEPPPPIAGMATRAARTPSPLSPDAADPAHHQPSADPAVQRLANAARRALASTSGGMQALLDLQGLSLPPAGHANRQHAEQAAEHYKLGLRAEDALITRGLEVQGSHGTADVQAALDRLPPVDRERLLNPDWLGSGNARRPGHTRHIAEDPSTLAAQAFTFATANRTRAATDAVAYPGMKPAYVALRNGFTESGQGSDFHLMTKRLHKFVKYIDLACKTPVGAGASTWARMKDPIGAMRRAVGKDKTPLKTLMQAGPLGSDLGTIPGEHRKRLDAALATSTRLLRADLAANAAGMSPQDRTRGFMRLAALALWAEKVPGTADLSTGVKLTPAEIVDRAVALAGAQPLDRATALSESGAHSARPLLPDTLHAWFGAGRLASATAAPRTDAEMTDLNRSVDTLRGKAKFDSELDRLQREFDRATPEDRRDILRQVLISVVAGGDMTDYSDGRKHGIGGMFGYGVASFEGLGGLTTGVTPVGEFNIDHTRTAVLKAGVASNTGVLFLGNETKVTEMIGGGVRVGAQVGPVVNLTGQAMARLGGSHLFSKGLMIRTSKQGTEHQALGAAQTAGMKSANWKQMSELVVNSIFQIADQPAAARPANGGAMWSQMVGKIGEYRDISFGWNEGKAHSAHISGSVDGIAAVKLGGGFKASAMAGVGLKHTFLNRSKARETAGATQTVQAGSGSRTSVGAGASVGVAHPTLQNPSNPDLAIFARHKVGVETELVIQAKNGFVRITTEDGKVKPNISYKHREFGVQDDFVKLVNGQRGHWEPRLGERGPDGTLRGGDRALDAFLQQMVNLPPGNNRLYIERKCLTPEAADTINACMERLAVLQRPVPAGTPPDAGAADQIHDLQQQIAAHVGEESSWQPFRLFVNESNQAARERGTSGEVRATPNQVDDTAAGPTGFAERFLGGGKVTLGGKVNTAHGGRDLLTIDAQPVRG